MPLLSVNLNKVAYLRNTRDVGMPDVLEAARCALRAGAHGITVHPRPDQRHITPSDVRELKALLANDFTGIEFNIEGNPFPEFMDLVREARPHQCTLVPDDPDQTTSDHGWDLTQDAERLKPIIRDLKDWGVRVSLFMDYDSPDIPLAKKLGADRIELYTEPYAKAFAASAPDAVFTQFQKAARIADEAGLGVNAGHDLNLPNLPFFCEIPNLLELSIGLALVADALFMGLDAAVRAYLKAMGN